MDESDLQARLARIERRQNLVLAFLVVAYLVGIAELVGVWKAGVAYAAVGVVLFAALVVRRRRARSTAEP